MKKTYIQPKLYIEKYTMTQAIAAPCEIGRYTDEGVSGYATVSDPENCFYIITDDIGESKYFLENSACEEFDDEFTYCYNGPEEGFFGSY